MTRLYLLRHAKARWAEPGVRDYDRPLHPSGDEDAEEMGREMQRSGFIPDLVLCSGAKRARDTWKAVARSIEVNDVGYSDALYSSDAAGYLDIIREAKSDGSILIVGHNPMMEDLAIGLARDGNEQAMAAARRGFPACGLAILRFPDSLSRIAPEDGFLEKFLKPAGI